MYGYRLSNEDKVEPVVYYNVSFDWVGDRDGTVLSYPEWCVRQSGPRFLPRSDPRPTVSKFLVELQLQVKELCGNALSFREKPLFPSVETVRSSEASLHSGNVCCKEGWTEPKIPFRVSQSRSSQHGGSWTKLPALQETTTVSASRGVGAAASTAELEVPAAGDGKAGVDTVIRIKPVFAPTPSAKSQPIASRKLGGIVASKPSFLSRLVSENLKTEKKGAAAAINGTRSSNILQRFIQTEKKDSSKLKTLSSSSVSSNSSSTAVISPYFGKPSSLGVTPPSSSVNPFPSPKPTQKKTPAVDYNLDLSVLAATGGSFAKVNTVTLLRYCKANSIKEAKARSKKEDLINLIRKHNNIMPEQ